MDNLYIISFFVTHEILHLLIGLLVGVLALFLFKKKKLILLSLIVTFGIDLDHLVDYFHYFGLNFQDPIAGPDFFCLSGKLFIPLHAWELIPLLIILSFVFKNKKVIFLSVVLALLGHYLLDQFSNGMCPFGYSLIYRFLNNFDINIVSFGCK